MTGLRGREPLTGERRMTSSPAWVVPFDDFQRLPSAAGVSAALDIWRDNTWQRTDIRATRTPGGVIAYPGLNRRIWPFDPQPQLYRCRLSAPGRFPLVLAEDGTFWADLVGVEFLAYPHNHDHPPELTAEPRLVPLLPGPSFPYPPGTRVVRGLVREAGSRQPIGNALVEAAGVTKPDDVPWAERALTDVDGTFALALRWEGVRIPGGETFHLIATETPDRTGALDIRLTGEPPGRLVIEIS